MNNPILILVFLSFVAIEMLGMEAEINPRKRRIEESSVAPELKRQYHAGLKELCEAVCQRDTSKIAALVKGGVPINGFDSTSYYQTPLHWALLYKPTNLNPEVLSREQLMSFLMQLGAHINAPDAIGRTVLHVAAERVDLAAVTFLLQNRAASNALDSKGNSPLSVFLMDRKPLVDCLSDKTFEHMELIVQLLLQAGTSITLKNHKGEGDYVTALRICQEQELLLGRQSKIAFYLKQALMSNQAFLSKAKDNCCVCAQAFNNECLEDIFACSYKLAHNSCIEKHLQQKGSCCICNESLPG